MACLLYIQSRLSYFLYGNPAVHRSLLGKKGAVSLAGGPNMPSKLCTMLLNAYSLGLIIDTMDFFDVSGRSGTYIMHVFMMVQTSHASSVRCLDKSCNINNR